jgi:hypothetical protein
LVVIDLNGSSVGPQAGGNGRSTLLFAGGDLVGSIQGKLIQGFQIP